ALYSDFIFLRSGGHRHLTSFPTRRSSDLLSLVLAVQVHEQRTELRQDADGRGAAVHPGAGAPLPGDLALQDESPRLRLHPQGGRSEEHTSELQSRGQLVCRLLREKKKDFD